MSRLLERSRKLRGVTIDELRLRATQAVQARLERFGPVARGREPSDAALTQLIDPRVAGERADADRLLERFRRQPPALVFAGLAEPRATVAVLTSRWPDGAVSAIAKADRIADGHLALAGRQLAIGPCPDWTLEPRSGKRAPLVHWSRVDFLDPDVAGDCKLTWELSRHQYFTTLGRAYWLTGDERYAEVFARHLASWMDENPPKLGINWTSSLELALRVISWTWALHFFRDSSHLTARLFVRTLKFLSLQGRHIERYLSTYFSPNTHITGEALGLLYLGVTFPALTGAGRWRALGCRILREQLHRQVLGDGVYFEQSTCYHRYTADFYLHAMLLADAQALPLGDLRKTLERLLDFLLYITRPDGTVPLIGDDDGGRLVMLADRQPNDFRDTLAVGAVLLQRGDYAYVAGEPTEELLWLLGPRGVRRFDRLAVRPPDSTSRAFPQGGYYVMRGSWDRHADCAIIRCGPHGALTGAHAHADALSIDLAVAGCPVLIDPGTYTYTGATEDRERFRASAAHNTLTIDDFSSAEPGPTAFSWRSAPQSRARFWVTHPRFDYFEGEHNGYERLQPAATHSRAVLRVKDEYWVILDRVATAGTHRFALHFHWPPATTARADGDGALTVRIPAGTQSIELGLRIFGPTGRFSCDPGWVSRSYGVRSPAPDCVFRFDGRGPQEVVTVLAPPAWALSRGGCWRTSAVGSGVLTLATHLASDILLVGPTRGAEGVTSDAHVTWVRRTPAGEVMEFALVGGQRLDIDGKRLFRAETTVECAVGRWHDGEWRLDISPPAPPADCAVRVEASLCAGSAE